MLYEYFRLLSYDGSNFTDLSLDNQNDSTNIDLALSTTDYLYIGQYYAFNNFHIHLDTANATSANLDIEYWDGTQWRDCVDILDGTKVSGATFAQSGVIQYSPDPDYSWNRVSDTSESYAPTEMQTLNIHEMYWLRLKPSANIDASTDAFVISYAFTTTQQLNDHDIEISTYYDRFASGKTDWIKEIKTASRYLVADLRRKNIIQDPAQILRFDDVSLACEWRTLALIYHNLGRSHADKKESAMAMYNDFNSIGARTKDLDGNAQVDLDEIKSSQRYGIR